MKKLKKINNLFSNWFGVSLLFILFTSSTLSAQINSVSGTVTDESDQPVVGATVLGRVLKFVPVANFNCNYNPIIPKDVPLQDFLI